MAISSYFYNLIKTISCFFYFTRLFYLSSSKYFCKTLNTPFSVFAGATNLVCFFTLSIPLAIAYEYLAKSSIGISLPPSPKAIKSSPLIPIFFSRRSRPLPLLTPFTLTSIAKVAEAKAEI